MSEVFEIKYILQAKIGRQQVTIFDENQNIIGYGNRFCRPEFKSRLYYYIMPPKFRDIKMEDERRNLILHLVGVPTVKNFLGVHKVWTGVIYSEPEVHFTMKFIFKLRMGWFLELEIDDKIIFIEDRTIGAEPIFYDSNRNIIAKCRDRIIGGKVDMDINEQEINVFLVAAITYLIREW